MFLSNWKTTLSGVVTGAALGYAGYATGNPELILAGVTAAAGGIMAKDAKTARAKAKKKSKAPKSIPE